MKRPISKNRSVIATFLISFVMIALFLVNSYQAANIIKARSMERMEEGVATVVDEIIAKLNRDSRVLNAAANIISSADQFDNTSTLEIIEIITPLLETMDICVLLQNNHVLQPDGSIIDTEGRLDFETEAALDEHVSNREISIQDDDTYVLRHFVPILRDGQTVALLYGRTRLDELQRIMNIDNIYNASADVYIIDAETGEYIMDTRHASLGVMGDFSNREVRGVASWEDVQRAIKNLEDGYVVFRSREGTRAWHNLYYTPAGINQWEIAVSVPEKEALASLYAMQRVFYVTGALMLVAIVVYYLWIRRNAKRTVDEAVERAVLEEKLHKAEAAERAKTAFLSNMSHDIRTPMNAIVGYTTLAQTNLDNREKVQDYLKKILSSSSHLLSLINDVLDMSRIESGKLNIEEKPCSISDIFRDMRNIIQPQMHTKKLSFFMDTVDVYDEEIYCDKLHLNQILLNLLSNAIKFTPAGGTVALTIRQKPGAPTGYGTYEIRVKDTGIGMGKEFATHIFEPFEREQNSTISGIQGTGLGMAITKSIVDIMGGTIQVFTEQGKGSEFVIELSFRLQSESKRADTVRELQGLRSLVVDDSFSTCDSVSKMLVEIGMRAEWTLYGKEAILRAKQAIEMGDEFYVYILDWTLPDLNGVEVARQLRALVGEKVPIIVLTAYDWTAIEDEAREAGVTAFCNKPIFLSELKDILATAVRQCEPAETSEPDLFVGVEELRGTRLLVVEDNALNREIAEGLLKEAGFEIESAEDGTVAVQMVQDSAPGYYSLILMDIQMPIMNGYDATRAIRALDDPELACIPIVAMTANAFEEDRQKAMSCGMNDHVAKPIDIEALLAAIRAILVPNESGDGPEENGSPDHRIG